MPQDRTDVLADQPLELRAIRVGQAGVLSRRFRPLGQLSLQPSRVYLRDHLQQSRTLGGFHDRLLSRLRRRERVSPLDPPTPPCRLDSVEALRLHLLDRDGLQCVTLPLEHVDLVVERSDLAVDVSDLRQRRLQRSLLLEYRG